MLEWRDFFAVIVQRGTIVFAKSRGKAGSGGGPGLGPSGIMLWPHSLESEPDGRRGRRQLGLNLCTSSRAGMRHPQTGVIDVNETAALKTLRPLYSLKPARAPKDCCLCGLHLCKVSI